MSDESILNSLWILGGLPILEGLPSSLNLARRCESVTAEYNAILQVWLHIGESYCNHMTRDPSGKRYEFALRAYCSYNCVSF